MLILFILSTTCPVCGVCFASRLIVARSKAVKNLRLNRPNALCLGRANRPGEPSCEGPRAAVATGVPWGFRYPTVADDRDGHPYLFPSILLRAQRKRFPLGRANRPGEPSSLHQNSASPHSSAKGANHSSPGQRPGNLSP